MPTCNCGWALSRRPARSNLEPHCLEPHWGCSPTLSDPHPTSTSATMAALFLPDGQRLLLTPPKSGPTSQLRHESSSRANMRSTGIRHVPLGGTPVVSPGAPEGWPTRRWTWS